LLNKLGENMKQLVNKFLRGVVALALFSGMVFVMPAALQAKPKSEISVVVQVTVHGSDIGVSEDVLEEMVDKLLEASEIHVMKEGADSSVTTLKIDIFKNDDGHGFKVDGNWDEDDEPEVEETCDTQDKINHIVEVEVNEFIKFIHKG
jgi:hypothetical protein